METAGPLGVERISFESAFEPFEPRRAVSGNDLLLRWVRTLSEANPGSHLQPLLDQLEFSYFTRSIVVPSPAAAALICIRTSALCRDVDQQGGASNLNDTVRNSFIRVSPCTIIFMIESGKEPGRKCY